MWIFYNSSESVKHVRTHATNHLKILFHQFDVDTLYVPITFFFMCILIYLYLMSRKHGISMVRPKHSVIRNFLVGNNLVTRFNVPLNEKNVFFFFFLKYDTKATVKLNTYWPTNCFQTWCRQFCRVKTLYLCHFCFLNSWRLVRSFL